MPNLLYMLVSLVYHLALALWIGGAVVLGAFVAPELFRSLPRSQAGGIFGPILRRFSRLRLSTVVLAVAAAATKRLLWESHSGNPWIAARWLALTILAAVTVYEIFSLEPAMAAHRAEMAPEGSVDDHHRLAFMRLHRRSEALMKVSLVAAVVAVFLG